MKLDALKKGAMIAVIFALAFAIGLLVINPPVWQ